MERATGSPLSHAVYGNHTHSHFVIVQQRRKKKSRARIGRNPIRRILTFSNCQLRRSSFIARFSFAPHGPLAPAGFGRHSHAAPLNQHHNQSKPPRILCRKNHWHCSNYLDTWISTLYSERASKVPGARIDPQSTPPPTLPFPLQVDSRSANTQRICSGPPHTHIHAHERSLRRAAHVAILVSRHAVTERERVREIANYPFGCPFEVQ